MLLTEWRERFRVTGCVATGALATYLSLPGAALGAPPDFTYTTSPAQPSLVAWPTQSWARGPSVSIDRKELDRAADLLWSPSAESPIGRINALVIVQGGRIVYERYRAAHSCDQIEHTMSIAKMMGAAMAGLLVLHRGFDIDAPLARGGWVKPDPRHAITARHALNMTTGLQWDESGDFLEFAFGDGALDLAKFVTEKPLAHAPGTHFQYSDGTPSLIGQEVLRATGGTRTGVVGFLRSSLLGPLGMTRTELEFDRRGTWYGSSGVRWSPCDLARFGLLLLRDGIWDGQRILPTGWVNFMRTPTEASMNAALPPGAPPEALEPYGAFADVYLSPTAVAARSRAPLPIDSFGHYGFGGSHLRVVPSRDLVLVVVGERGRDPYAMLETFRLAEKISNAFAVAVAPAQP